MIPKRKITHVPQAIILAALLASVTAQGHELSHAVSESDASEHVISEVLADVQHCKMHACSPACKISTQSFKLAGLRIPYPSIVEICIALATLHSTEASVDWPWHASLRARFRCSQVPFDRVQARGKLP